DAVLRRTDPRAGHILYVLRRSPGDVFDVGLVDGRVGKARLVDADDAEIRLQVEWTGAAPDLHPITAIIGMPRPQTARRLLRELTSMGVGRLVFFDTDRSEPGYRDSKLWTTNECRRHLISGAEQAFNPRLPDLLIVPDLATAIGFVEPGSDRIGLDNYESPVSLTSWMPASPRVAIALGAERGWSAGERDVLRRNKFNFFHMGARVLRLETAAVAGVTIVLSRMGRL
ncbi:MAG TPA: RsmE family RNA methyltransferase, partial [Rhodothermia bacterium]